jgi:uncharacterized BrkB/YihY/UPF0761 family membrane protein
MDLIEKIAKHSQGAAQRLQVKSALNPILWLIAVVLPVCLYTAYAFRDYSFALTFLLITALLPIIVACFGFIYLLIYKPEKLQSEDYQIKQQVLQTITEKTGKFAQLKPEVFFAIVSENRKQLEEVTKQQNDGTE